MRDLDVVERTMLETLARGPIYRIVRLVKNGPLCPAATMWVTTRAEPGQPDNRMERSPFIAAFVSGEPTDPRRLFASGKAGSTHIDAKTYAALLAEIAANVRAGRYDPRTAPFSPVDVARLPLPFAKDARHAPSP